MGLTTHLQGGTWNFGFGSVAASVPAEVNNLDFVVNLKIIVQLLKNII